MDRKTFFSLSSQPGCILDKDRRFVFFCHNKVAQTSINRNLLKERAIVRKDNGKIFHYHRIKNYLYYDFSHPFTFTIVRNPYDRVVSAFEHLKKFEKVKSNWTFDYFVREILIGQRENFDIHFLPQFHWSRPLSKINFDYIGKFETLKEDWKNIAPEISAYPTLPHVNKGKSIDFRDYYSDELKNIIYNMYKDDFIEFEYKKDF